MILVSKSSTGNPYNLSPTCCLSSLDYTALSSTLQRAFASNTQRAWGATDVGSGRGRRPFIPPVPGWSAVWRRPRSARTDVTQRHMTHTCRWSCCSVITQQSGCETPVLCQQRWVLSPSCTYCSLRRWPWAIRNQAGVLSVYTHVHHPTSEIAAARREGRKKPVM